MLIPDARACQKRATSCGGTCLRPLRPALICYHTNRVGGCAVVAPIPAPVSPAPTNTPCLQNLHECVYSHHHNLRSITCVPSLHRAGSKQGNLGRPPILEWREQRDERLTHHNTVSAKKPSYGHQSLRSKAWGELTRPVERVHTHVWRYIKKRECDPSPKQIATPATITKQHTKKHTYKYLAPPQNVVS